MERLIKYKWYILGYILYISIVQVWLSTFSLHREYWNLLLIFAVIIPIALYMLYSLWLYYKKKNENKQDSMSCEDDTTQKQLKQDNNTCNVYKPNSFSEAWLFTSFVKTFGPNIGLASHVNSKTNAMFHTCEICDSKGKTVSVRFDPSLGELTPDQLKERKSELFVGKRKDNNRYYLYDINYREWYDVEL